MSKIIELSAISVYLIVMSHCIALAQDKIAKDNSDIIQQILTLSPKQAAARLDNLIQAKTAFPLIVDSTALLVYKGNEDDVTVRGDFTQWRSVISMKRLAGTPYCFVKLTLPNSVRVGYEFLVHGSPRIDPLNPIVENAGNASQQITMSIIEMPRYVRHRFSTRLYSPQGVSMDTTFFDPSLPTSIRVRVCLPASYSATITYPLTLFFDGSLYEQANATTTITNMIGRKVIAPSIAAFLRYDIPLYGEGTSQSTDGMNARITDYVARVILPWIRRSYSVRTTKELNSIVASSGSALNAFRLCDSVPAFFGTLCFQSPVFTPALLMRFMEDAGSMPNMWIEHDVYDDSTFKQYSIAAYSLIQRTGKKVHYAEYSSGSVQSLATNRLPELMQFISDPLAQTSTVEAMVVYDPRVEESKATKVSTTDTRNNVPKIQIPELVPISFTISRPQNVFIEIRYERNDKKTGIQQTGIVEKLFYELLERGEHRIEWDSTIATEQGTSYSARIICDERTFDIPLVSR